MKPLYLTTFFHLNLAYSSIEEGDRTRVIERCYGPLLDVIENTGFPCGIEASAYTLEQVAAIVPSWIARFSNLVEQGLCELIASGYSQAIGPLLPAGVNAANLSLGNRRYRELLGITPRIVLVNEQAYSSGMIAHYLDAGYEAMVMEWNNPALSHRHWDPEWRYLPQYAVDQQGRKLPVIWNNSIFFQKFQHYAHCEKELDEYVDYLASHRSDHPRCFPLYGNDVEIFDFRPGRFHTEAHLGPESEWLRIQALLTALRTDDRFDLIIPSSTLSLLDLPKAGNELSLESPAIPIPVKKQEKYNITRWAVTGRDDLGINTACRRIYEGLIQRGDEDPESWRELCYLWSSDFRTHITQKRWEAYLARLSVAQDRFVHCPGTDDFASTMAVTRSAALPDYVAVIRRGRILSIDTDTIKVDLNTRRGLAIDGVCFKTLGQEKLFGTLPHGFYDNITLGADFYSGHLVFETLGNPKLTDLELVEPDVLWNSVDRKVVVSCAVKSALGDIRKSVLVQPETGAIELVYAIDWRSLPVGSLRLGMISLFPESFSQETLFFRTHNGGPEMETFHPRERSINHGESASFLVSAKHALGVTEGILEIGDADKFLRLSIDTSLSTVISLITFAPLNGTYFFRCALSAREMDETSRASENPVSLRFKIKITACSS